MAHILFAGESSTVTTISANGFDTIISSAYVEEGTAFLDALRSAGHRVDYQPNHTACEQFPETHDALADYDLVVLSDIGANTLLMPGRVRAGVPTTNRLNVLAGWVRQGGALLMVGGYLSFTGYEAKANYRNTPLAAALPVELETGDDREEAPEGVHVTLTADGRASLPGVDADWPPILGFQRLQAKPGSRVLADVSGHPIIVIGDVGEGRSAAVATDLGPHWLSQEFMRWNGYPILWNRLVDQLIR